MSALNKLFKKKDPKEQVREAQRGIGRNVRDLEREIMVLKREEAQIVKQIKDAAAKDNVAGAKLLAKQLVRLRGQQTKLYTAIASLRGVSASVVTAAATSTVATSMGGATKVMQAMGKTADLQKMQRNIQDFSKENAKMEMASEMMDDTMENALDGEEVEDETNELVDQVLAGIGVDVAGQMAGVGAPKQRVAQRQQPQQQQVVDSEEDLVARLAALK